MEAVLLIIHLLVAIALVVVILLQKSEGGALGIGGSTSGGLGLFTARGASNLLTRTTAILAVCFIAISLMLAILASRNQAPVSILDQTPAQQGTGNEAETGTNDTVPLPVVPLGQ